MSGWKGTAGTVDVSCNEREEAVNCFTLWALTPMFVSSSYLALAVKRLMKEAAELRDPTEHYHAQPLEVS